MKIEDVYCVLIKDGDIELNIKDGYLKNDFTFTEDIREAVRCANKTTALMLNEDFYEQYSYELRIVPLKVTYEW